MRRVWRQLFRASNMLYQKNGEKREHHTFDIDEFGSEYANADINMSSRRSMIKQDYLAVSFLYVPVEDRSKLWLKNAVVEPPFSHLIGHWHSSGADGF